MADIYSLVQYLFNTGFIELFVPFILIFALVYSAFVMSGVFKDDKVGKNIKTVIAAAIAFLAISPHFFATGSRYDIVAVMLQVLPDIGLLFVAVIAVLMLISLTGFDVGESLASWFTIGAVVFIVYLFLVASDILQPLSWLDNDIISALIALVVFFLVVSYITGEKKEKPKEYWKELGIIKERT